MAYTLMDVIDMKDEKPDSPASDALFMSLDAEFAKCAELNNCDKCGRSSYCLNLHEKISSKSAKDQLDIVQVSNFMTMIRKLTASVADYADSNLIKPPKSRRI